MREAPVERYLRTQVELAGGRCVKLSPLGYVGIPDRMVLLPHHGPVFVELKRPKGGRYSAMQDHWHEWLTTNGFTASRIKNLGEVDVFIRHYKSTRRGLGH